MTVTAHGVEKPAAKLTKATAKRKGKQELNSEGKDGRYEKVSQSAVVVPKNPLTVQYLCHAYDVPYPTFKRWKADAFQTKVFVQPHKGKTVLTCPLLATQVYNVRRIYCDHQMAVWLHKNPHRKYDSIGKKICVLLL